MPFNNYFNLPPCLWYASPVSKLTKFTLIQFSGNIVLKSNKGWTGRTFCNSITVVTDDNGYAVFGISCVGLERFCGPHQKNRLTDVRIEAVSYQESKNKKVGTFFEGNIVKITKADGEILYQDQDSERSIRESYSGTRSVFYYFLGVKLCMLAACIILITKIFRRLNHV